MITRRTLIITAALSGLAAVAWAATSSRSIRPTIRTRSRSRRSRPQQAAAAAAAPASCTPISAVPHASSAIRQCRSNLSQSLGSFVILKLNPGSALAGDEISACAAVRAIVREHGRQGRGSVRPSLSGHALARRLSAPCRPGGGGTRTRACAGADVTMPAGRELKVRADRRAGAKPHTARLARRWRGLGCRDRGGRRRRACRLRPALP